MDALESNALQNIHVDSIQPLIPPMEVKEKYPVTPQLEKQILEHRDIIKNIISGKDTRLLLVIGPCSIHDEKAALDYAKRLAEAHKKFSDRLFIAMRVYFEKPRTIVGWKGLINDPDLDNSCNMNKGLLLARKLLIDIANLGLPIATEMLDPVVPQYTADLISWSAIGARTTESQTHREMVSGLSMPVGFKNATNGNVQVAVNAIQSAQNKHSFIGVNRFGQSSIVRTSGNPYCHLVLRGGDSGPNFSEAHISEYGALLHDMKVCPSIMVDCNHANSDKNHEKQEIAWMDVMQQRVKGNTHLIGLMLESNIYGGNQPIRPNLEELKYGISITDACLDWINTERLLSKAYELLG